MKLFVYHTPESVPPGSPDCAIVVDILRATTTIATALAAGAEFVQVFASLDDLDRMSSSYPQGHCLRAAERGGKKVEGYDLGNSPLDYTPDRVKGRGVLLSTTNGTRALQRVSHAPQVLTAAFVNLGVITDFVKSHQPQTVWIVGSGWEGSFSLEDTACAGALATRLGEMYQAGNDEAVAAQALYLTWQNQLERLFHHAAHGQRLLKLQGEADLAYCAKVDLLRVVPLQREPGILRANLSQS